MNGNCVLIPAAIAQSIGNIEKSFAHAMGDLDYGLRAKKAGFSVWIMPGYAGICPKNSITGTFYDRTLPVTQRLRKMMQPKGLPPSSWWLFARRHGGFFWLAFFIWPYLRILL